MNAQRVNILGFSFNIFIFQIKEISGESFFQAYIQTSFWIHNESRFSRTNIFGVVLSYISVFYGTSSFNVYVLYDNKPKIFNVLRILFADVLYMIISFFIPFVIKDYILIMLSEESNVFLEILFHVLIYICIVYIYFIFRFKELCSMCNSAICMSGTLGTLPYSLYNRKHTLKDIKEIRQNYSFWVFSYLLIYLLIKGSLSQNKKLRSFEKSAYYNAVNTLLPIILFLSLTEFILVKIFDRLIFKLAYDIKKEVENNVEDIELVEIV